MTIVLFHAVKLNTCPRKDDYTETLCSTSKSQPYVKERMADMAESGAPPAWLPVLNAGEGACVAITSKSVVLGVARPGAAFLPQGPGLATPLVLVAARRNKGLLVQTWHCHSS